MTNIKIITEWSENHLEESVNMFLNIIGLAFVEIKFSTILGNNGIYYSAMIVYN
jgi:hypothetical protein